VGLSQRNIDRTGSGNRRYRRAKPPTGNLKSAPRSSIVVLPYSNLSNDSDREYVADGITDDLKRSVADLRYSLAKGMPRTDTRYQYSTQEGPSVYLPNPSFIHSVDFHAATGPGGGAALLQVNPGDEKAMAFKALVPGLYVYHCATPMVAEHLANGMYGMILVEPEDGLEKVDHEFYLMQGEVYTDAAFGRHGSQGVSVERLLAERPAYFVFNGSGKQCGCFSVSEARISHRRFT
jgi:hypothetical protein